MTTNLLTQEKLSIFCSNETSGFIIQLSFDQNFIDNLTIENGNEVSASDFITQWLQILSQEKSQQGNHKIGGYTINQLIFDTSIAYNPNKKKPIRKVDQAKKANKLEAFKQQIIEWLSKGVSHGEIAKRLQCHINTLKSYIKTQSLSGA